MKLNPLFLLAALFPATVMPINAEISFAQQSQEWQHKIIPLERNFSIDEKLGFIKVSGHWERAITHSKYPQIKRMNSTEIICFRKYLECTEIIAQIDDKEYDGKLSVDGQLWAIQRTFKIIEWSPTMVVAHLDNPVMTLELRFFKDGKTADRLRREKDNPSVLEQWILK